MLAGEAVAGVPRIVYFHENQLLYPNRHTAEWDYQFALTNITSALVADRCLFNSRYNLDGFLAEIPGFLREFPDHRPHGVAERIVACSEVVPPPYWATGWCTWVSQPRARSTPGWRIPSCIRRRCYTALRSSSWPDCGALSPSALLRARHVRSPSRIPSTGLFPGMRRCSSGW